MVKNTEYYRLKKIFSDRELEVISVVRNFRITATDGINLLLEKTHLNLAKKDYLKSGPQFQRKLNQRIFQSNMTPSTSNKITKRIYLFK